MINNSINRFTIRVYGILEWNQKLLLVHERIRDFSFTKFPGGGLEFGEGTRLCLEREFMEEAGIRVEVGEHFYTTDYFQQSAFRETDQLISVYYKVKCLDDPANIGLDEIEVFENGQPEQLRFFWVSKNELEESMVTFPIDKQVIRMLLNQG